MSDAAATLTQDRQRLELSALSAPAVIFTVAMIAFPVVYTIWLSFQSFSSTGQQSFAGLANYAKLTSDYEFWNGLWVTIALYVLSLVLQLVFGVWLALVLFHAKRLPGIVRSMFISPFMMPPVVAGMMWLVILDPSLGAANYILQTLGLPPSDWLASPTWVIPTVALIDSWQWTPYVALIVLGGLQSLPPSVYEAAQIDGASPFKTVPAHHAAAAAADHRHRGHPAQRRSPAFLRHHLHHDPGRSRQCVEHAQHLRLPGRL